MKLVFRHALNKLEKIGLKNKILENFVRASKDYFLKSIDRSRAKVNLDFEKKIMLEHPKNDDATIINEERTRFAKWK